MSFPAGSPTVDADHDAGEEPYEGAGEVPDRWCDRSGDEERGRQLALLDLGVESPDPVVGRTSPRHHSTSSVHESAEAFFTPLRTKFEELTNRYSPEQLDLVEEFVTSFRDVVETYTHDEQ